MKHGKLVWVLMLAAAWVAVCAFISGIILLQRGVPW